MCNLQQTMGAVQTNCDIADARHARDMSMCNYLPAMRDFYRWEQQVPFMQPLKKVISVHGFRNARPNGTRLKKSITCPFRSPDTIMTISIPLP